MKKYLKFCLSLMMIIPCMFFFIGCGDNSPATIESYAVTNCKTSYELGDDFSVEGAKIILTMTDKTTKEIQLTNDMVLDAPDLTVEGDKYITIMYNGIPYTLIINVSANKAKFFAKIQEFLNSYNKSTATFKGTMKADLTANWLGEKSELKVNEDFDFNTEAGYGATQIVYELIKNTLIGTSNKIGQQDITNVADLTANLDFKKLLDGFSTNFSMFEMGRFIIPFIAKDNAEECIEIYDMAVESKDFETFAKALLTKYKTEIVDHIFEECEEKISKNTIESVIDNYINGTLSMYDLIDIIKEINFTAGDIIKIFHEYGFTVESAQRIAGKYKNLITEFLYKKYDLPEEVKDTIFSLLKGFERGTLKPADFFDLINYYNSDVANLYKAITSSENFETFVKEILKPYRLYITDYISSQIQCVSLTNIQLLFDKYVAGELKVSDIKTVINTIEPSEITLLEAVETEDTQEIIRCALTEFRKQINGWLDLYDKYTAGSLTSEDIAEFLGCFGEGLDDLYQSVDLSEDFETIVREVLKPYKKYVTEFIASKLTFIPLTDVEKMFDKFVDRTLTHDDIANILNEIEPNLGEIFSSLVSIKNVETFEVLVKKVLTAYETEIIDLITENTPITEEHITVVIANYLKGELTSNDIATALNDIEPSLGEVFKGIVITEDVQEMIKAVLKTYKAQIVEFVTSKIPFKAENLNKIIDKYVAGTLTNEDIATALNDIEPNLGGVFTTLISTTDAEKLIKKILISYKTEISTYVSENIVFMSKSEIESLINSYLVDELTVELFSDKVSKNYIDYCVSNGNTRAEGGATLLSKIMQNLFDGLMGNEFVAEDFAKDIVKFVDNYSYNNLANMLSGATGLKETSIRIVLDKYFANTLTLQDLKVLVADVDENTSKIYEIVMNATSVEGVIKALLTEFKTDMASYYSDLTGITTAHIEGIIQKYLENGINSITATDVSVLISDINPLVGNIFKVFFNKDGNVYDKLKAVVDEYKTEISQYIVSNLNIKKTTADAVISKFINGTFSVKDIALIVKDYDEKIGAIVESCFNAEDIYAVINSALSAYKTDIAKLVSQYIPVSQADVELIITKYINKTMTTDDLVDFVENIDETAGAIFNCLVNAENPEGFAKALLNMYKNEISAELSSILAYNFNLEGKEELDDVIYNLIVDIVNDRASIGNTFKNLIDYSEKYCDKETQTILYSMSAMYICLTNPNADYNEVFSFIDLPEGIESIDYNELVKALSSQATYERAFQISKFESKFVKDANDNIIKEIITFKLDVDFDIMFTSVVGAIELSFEIIY